MYCDPVQGILKLTFPFSNIKGILEYVNLITIIQTLHSYNFEYLWRLTQ
jgi:hypothetical protein